MHIANRYGIDDKKMHSNERLSVLSMLNLLIQWHGISTLSLPRSFLIWNTNGNMTTQLL